MAILIPESCRNVTSGSLRELSKSGHTTGSGGLFNAKFIKGQLCTATPSDYTSKIEPMGKYMQELDSTQKKFEESADAISASIKKMVSAAEVAHKQLHESSAKMRDGTDKLGAAMTKFSTITNNSKFAETAKIASSLVESLERLAVLQRTGMLDKVLQAMSKG